VTSLKQEVAEDKRSPIFCAAGSQFFPLDKRRRVLAKRRISSCCRLTIQADFLIGSNLEWVAQMNFFLYFFAYYWAKTPKMGQKWQCN